MIEPTILDHVPLWAFFLGTLVITVATAECGYRLGRRRAGGTAEARDSDAVAVLVGTTLGLLAFLLAFTFGLAASRYDSRREAFQEEVNAIRAAFLRSTFLPTEQGASARKLLSGYVKVRLDAYESQASLAAAIAKSRELHKDLWKIAAAVGRDLDKPGAPNSDMLALYVDALNQVIAAHANRTAAVVRARVPAAIWAGLVIIALIGFLSMGYNLGAGGATRSMVAIGMILCFALTMYLIADLDRPLEGFIRVNAQAMIELRDSMNDDGP
jgi:hypothetical protein